MPNKKMRETKEQVEVGKESLLSFLREFTHWPPTRSKLKEDRNWEKEIENLRQCWSPDSEISGIIDNVAKALRLVEEGKLLPVHLSVVDTLIAKTPLTWEMRRLVTLSLGGEFAEGLERGKLDRKRIRKRAEEIQKELEILTPSNLRKR